MTFKIKGPMSKEKTLEPLFAIGIKIEAVSGNKKRTETLFKNFTGAGANNIRAASTGAR